jgi:hypothetical protein
MSTSHVLHLRTARNRTKELVMSPIDVDNTTTTHTATPHTATPAQTTSALAASAPVTRPVRTELPIRRLGGMEIPAPGRWPLQTTSYVAHPSKRGAREQLAVRNGWLDLDHDPAQCWLHIELADRVIDLTATEIHEDNYGLSAWHMEGIADDGTDRRPITMSLRYHGVFRRGDEMWAWFSGTGVIEGHGAGGRATRRARERLHVDLLFDAR